MHPKNTEVILEKDIRNENSNAFLNFEVNQSRIINEGCHILNDETSLLLNELLSNPKIVSKEEKDSIGLKDLAVVSFSSLNHMNEAV